MGAHGACHLSRVQVCVGMAEQSSRQDAPLRYHNPTRRDIKQSSSDPLMPAADTFSLRRKPHLAPG